MDVYGTAYLRNESLSEHLPNYLQKQMTFSTSLVFTMIQFQSESMTTIGDHIDELVHQSKKKALKKKEMFVVDLGFQTRVWPSEQQSVKHSFYFMNAQKDVDDEILNSMLNNTESVSETCQKFFYAREDNSSKDGSD